ncbi:hypothetical protein ACFC58_41430, partial [Kitasatospora purpeofusca]|uniref:hypothetical protein n=1 Tax=Kitasatospora purpeofusca TaxID=67352 RepID=UPI0035D7300F
MKRILDRPVDEHGADEVSYRMVRGYVAERRQEIHVEAGRGAVEAFVPQARPLDPPPPRTGTGAGRPGRCEA